MIAPTENETVIVQPTYGGPIELDTEQRRSRAVCAMPDCPWMGEWGWGTGAFDVSNRHVGDHRRGRVPMLPGFGKE